MRGRDPDERGRSATPLELFYDLTYVVAFGAAAAQLAHHVIDGEVGPAIGAFAFAIWAVSWAWMNFTWFASAYGNDDALFRIATIVQMIGVVILALGLPVSFDAAAEGHSPNNALMVVGYVIMRVPLIGLWLRAAQEDPAHRRTAVAYAIIIAIAQVGWVLTTVVHLPVGVTVGALVALALAEMVAPVVAERRLGPVPWNAGHIAERFALLTLICLGEVVAATTGAVATLTGAQGWSVAAAVIAASGLLLAAALWWAYFLIPSRAILEEWPGRTVAWRYAHLPIFGAIVAVGAGLEVAAAAVEEADLSLLTVSLALVVPVGAVIVTIFATWSVLMHSYDLTHVPLFLLSLVPLAAALAVGLAAGPDDPVGFHGSPGDTTALVAVIALVMLSAVVEVVGHEKVGYPHTIRVIEAKASARPG
ncbi:low temperature requirement protein A [Blastococcus sp. CT_GayMR16]|nr:low temperature requirement protein A [Blastococcus sp. CT_GayMR16]